MKRNNYPNAGISCLTSKLDNHLMWSHYTNNYNGFVLKFNKILIENEMSEEYKASALAPVIYMDNPIKIEENKPYTHQYLFTTKLKHWEYEEEWRIVTELKSKNREMYYSQKCITEIYIGHKVFDNNLGLYKMLLEIRNLKYPKASVYVVYPHPTDLKLKFEKVLN